MPDTGAPYFIPFADSTDLVRDWPELSEDVALAIVAALENIPVLEKRIAAFTGSGNWTVPAGVTYAIAHMLGGGGGSGQSATAGNGSASSVDFAAGLVSAPGGLKGVMRLGTFFDPQTGPANSGQPSTFRGESGATDGVGFSGGNGGSTIVAGGAVTPAATVAVVVGAGGSAGTNGAAGGSGYVYIEYYEEV
jgi:hypothetical protein